MDRFLSRFAAAALLARGAASGRQGRILASKDGVTKG
jgi:hypothetical protein